MAECQDQPLRILVVKAHPHDFTHCAGTCGIHVARGDSVTVVCITDGVTAHNERLHDELIKPEKDRDPAIVNQPAEEYAKEKAGELRNACALFGITDVRVLGYPMPFRLGQAQEAVERLRDIICELRPHVLITQKPHLEARHGMASGIRDDHSETAFAVAEAAGLAGRPDYLKRESPHTIAATYYPGVYYMIDEIDFFVDIAEWKEQRVQAEIIFSSQGHTEAFARKRVEIGAGHMGWYAGVGYAEGFVRAAAEVLPRIMVPEFALRRASEPRKDHIKRISGERVADAGS